MKKTKKILIGLLVSLFVVSFVSCGGDKTENNSVPISSEQKISSSKEESSKKESSSEKESSSKDEVSTESEGLRYKLSQDKTYYSVVGIGTCTDIDIVIPSIYKSLPVTSIGDEAFYYCTSLKSVVIPNSVTSIGELAFGYTSIFNVNIPANVTNIENNPFFGCWYLTDIEVSEDNETYKSIDGNLYTKDGKILMQYAIGKTATTFSIPDSVTNIADSAFFLGKNLQSVVMSDGVVTIGLSAFSGCLNLTNIVISSKMTSIGKGVFSGCTNLTSITFNGTTEQWAAIEKGSLWNYNVPATEVVCSDGTVAL